MLVCFLVRMLYVGLNVLDSLQGFGGSCKTSLLYSGNIQGRCSDTVQGKARMGE